ncbi:MerR family transcriptional regulator [Nonomuraea jiangxiensis]|uniref:DNA-binding transcriptional regulator, MerR family n=1 Tax=Nonomuraea jiangxiensis TaxID=633440 RepID=A0A1G8TPB9_9ACTN|nr:MerR family transcriptional regulator [Nonomuraea jiangxiensis]SDJ43287.1 DNA-binding transcriptional regulator, MerR family [Nonomuraea jiangxiensis]
MGWSTREVAQLAGTTLRTVRHYHDIGLLDEPERLSNGYKVYRTEHLVRLLQIRRLTGLGFSLAMIAAMEDESEDLEETLDTVDAELAATITRLEEAREEIAKLRHRPVPTDLPFGISAAATDARLSHADRSLFAVLSQVIGEDNTQHWQALLQDYERDEATDEFDALPPDADEETRERLAQRMLPQMMAVNEKHPAPPRTVEHAAVGRHEATSAVFNAVLDLYNPAQLDVLVRIWKHHG